MFFIYKFVKGLLVDKVGSNKIIISLRFTNWIGVTCQPQLPPTDGQIWAISNSIKSQESKSVVKEFYHNVLHPCIPQKWKGFCLNWFVIRICPAQVKITYLLLACHLSFYFYLSFIIDKNCYPLSNLSI